MAGFASVKDWVDSIEEGKGWLSVFRKVPASAATITGQWYDYSTSTGIPVPNYYASSPLVGAVLDGRRGIYVPSVAPAHQYVRRLVVMSGAAGVTTTTSQNQRAMLLDYLLYYPFIDLDAAGDQQDLDNTVTLPRYTDGEGVRMMLVAQSPTNGGGNLTITYTNSDGVEGRSTGVVYCAAAQPSGALVSSIATAAGVSPFVPLQSGDRGVRSVQSVVVNTNNGGLAAVVLVRPLTDIHLREECRRPTSSPTESYGDATEVEYLRMIMGAPRILDGAFLSFIGQGSGGSIASSQLVGTLETVWR